MFKERCDYSIPALDTEILDFFEAHKGDWTHWVVGIDRKGEIHTSLCYETYELECGEAMAPTLREATKKAAEEERRWHGRI